jgi:hypothetical protein
MKSVKWNLLAAAAVGVVSIGGVKAQPASNLTGLGRDHLQNVRWVCGHVGRCHARKAYARRYRHSYNYYGQPDIRASQPVTGAVQPDISQIPAPGIGAFTGG